MNEYTNGGGNPAKDGIDAAIRDNNAAYPTFTRGQKVRNNRGVELTVCCQNGCVVTVYEDPCSYHPTKLWAVTEDK
jgi:hypothetical protein